MKLSPRSTRKSGVSAAMFASVSSKAGAVSPWAGSMWGSASTSKAYFAPGGRRVWNIRPGPASESPLDKTT
jgi:hypothetical protein